MTCKHYARTRPSPRPARDTTWWLAVYTGWWSIMSQIPDCYRNQRAAGAHSRPCYPPLSVQCNQRSRPHSPRHQAGLSYNWSHHGRFGRLDMISLGHARYRVQLKFHCYSNEYTVLRALSFVIILRIKTSKPRLQDPVNTRHVTVRLRSFTLRITCIPTS